MSKPMIKPIIKLNISPLTLEQHGCRTAWLYDNVAI
jgi:hypothetical protein